MPRREHLVLCGGVNRPRDAGVHTLRLRLPEQPSSNVRLRITDISKRLVANMPDVLIDLLQVAAYVIALAIWLHAFLRNALSSPNTTSLMIPASNLLAYLVGPIALTQPPWLVVAVFGDGCSASRDSRTATPTHQRCSTK
jgi:hypothetical protein